MDIDYFINRYDNIIISYFDNMTDREIIKLIEDNVIDIDYYGNVWNEDLLLLACAKCKHVNVIKYLIENKKMSLHTSDVYNRNPLMLACRYNCLHVVKYLTTNTCFTYEFYENEHIYILYSCLNINGLEIVKYLTNIFDINSNSIDHEFLIRASKSNNFTVVKYLIEHFRITKKIVSDLTYINFYFMLITLLDNRAILNNLIQQVYECHSSYRHRLKHVVDKYVNKIKIEIYIIDLLNIKDPFDDTFDDYILNVNVLEHPIDIYHVL